MESGEGGVTTPESEPNHKVMYLVIGGVVLLLVLVGLFSFRSKKADAEADQKADQLIAALQAQGLRAPPKQMIVRVLGDDGGQLCDHPTAALKRAAVYGMLTNGAGGPGQRPVIADNKVLKGQEIVISVYCPETLENFKEFVNDLDLENTTGD